MQDLTPRQIVAELDKYIVGQEAAKKAVAVALRNRVRRGRVAEEMRDEITPKNMMMIGPTGVGKTEIARRVARLIDAPFVKVEATKFTEVGYVGRDVDSIVRDLAESAFRLEYDNRVAEVRVHAEALATERIVNYLLEQRADLHSGKRARKGRAKMQAQAQVQAQVGGEPIAMVEEGASSSTAVVMEVPQAQPISERALKLQRRKLTRLLSEHKLDEEQIEIDAGDGDLGDDLSGVLEFSPGMSAEEMSDSFNEFLDGYRSIQSDMRSFSTRRRMRRVSVREAQRILTDEESSKLLDMDTIVDSAIRRAEQSGVVFIDELDKLAGPPSETGPDVSGGGVQRDLLPIVEGSTVQTRYGPLKTDHVLFIAAGAFHTAKPSDLIPELQGRFPLRVELESLGRKELTSILTEPQNSLTKQYEALMETEDVRLEFTEDGLHRIAEVAAELNERVEDIGARRLHTLMEQVLEEVAFNAEDFVGKTVVVDGAFVDSRVKNIVKDEDLSRFIL
ncbi:MAG: ATP-dependent protease ATPase subunit HslU [Chloroflexia bacterium]